MTDFSRRWVNLASAKLGAAAIRCSDDFFAPMHRMLQDQPPVFIDGKYDDHGKWMDGWESRRKRSPGHDWCVVKLAKPGVIHGIEIDTAHFTGNYPPAAAVEACRSEIGHGRIGVGFQFSRGFFTDQFSGSGLTDDLRLDRTIDGISGATLSVRALKKLARLALYLHEQTPFGNDPAP